MAHIQLSINLFDYDQGDKCAEFRVMSLELGQG